MSDYKTAATEEFPERLGKIQTLLSKTDADLLLIDQAEFMQWLGGFTSSETLYRVLLVPRKGAPWYVIRDIDRAPCQQSGWITEIESYADHEDGWQQVAQSIIRRGFETATIALDYHSYGCTLESWHRMHDTLPDARFIRFPISGDRLRQVKFPSELACLKQAAQIADTTMQTVATRIKPGDSAREATAIASGAFVRLGADSGDSGPIVRSAGDNEFLHSHQLDHPLEEGDVLHVELIPKVHNYSARLMRPIVIGDIPATLQETANKLITLQDQQIAAMCSGALASEVDSIVRQGVLDAGLRESYTNVTGYALGLYARTPRLSDFSLCFQPNADWRLEENMVFHMYISAGRLGFSETVRVGKNGGERLTQMPREILSAGLLSTSNNKC